MAAAECVDEQGESRFFQDIEVVERRSRSLLDPLGDEWRDEYEEMRKHAESETLLYANASTELQAARMHANLCRGMSEVGSKVVLTQERTRRLAERMEQMSDTALARNIHSQEDAVQALRRHVVECERSKEELSAQNMMLQMRLHRAPKSVQEPSSKSPWPGTPASRSPSEALEGDLSPSKEVLMFHIATQGEDEDVPVSQLRAELLEMSQRFEVAEGTCERVVQAEVEARQLHEDMSSLQTQREKRSFEGVMDAIARNHKDGMSLHGLRQELQEKLQEHYDNKSIRLWRGAELAEMEHTEVLPSESARRQLDDIESKLGLLGTEEQLAEVRGQVEEKCDFYTALEVQELLPARDFFEAFFDEGDFPSVGDLKTSGFTARDAKELLQIVHPSDQSSELLRVYFREREPSVEVMRKSGCSPKDVLVLLDLDCGDALIEAGLKLKGDEQKCPWYDGEEVVVDSILKGGGSSSFFTKVTTLRRAEAWAGKNFMFVRKTGEGAPSKDFRNGRYFCYKAYALEWSD